MNFSLTPGKRLPQDGNGVIGAVVEQTGGQSPVEKEQEADMEPDARQQQQADAAV